MKISIFIFIFLKVWIIVGKNWHYNVAQFYWKCTWNERSKLQNRKLQILEDAALFWFPPTAPPTTVRLCCSRPFLKFIVCVSITTWLITSSDNGRRRPESEPATFPRRVRFPFLRCCVDDLTELRTRVLLKCAPFCFNCCACVYCSVLLFVINERWGGGDVRPPLSNRKSLLRVRSVAMSSSTKKSSARRSE